MVNNKDEYISCVHVWAKDTDSNDWAGIYEANIEEVNTELLIEVLEEIQTELTRRNKDGKHTDKE